MDIARATRAELEGVIIENNILPTDNEDQLARIIYMTDNELRRFVATWMLERWESSSRSQWPKGLGPGARE
jgi:hypothetical protein